MIHSCHGSCPRPAGLSRRRAERNTVAERGIEDGPRLPVRTRPIALAEADQRPPGPSRAMGARAFHPDQQRSRLCSSLSPRGAPSFRGRSPEPPPPPPHESCGSAASTRGRCAKAAVTHGSGGLHSIGPRKLRAVGLAPRELCLREAPACFARRNRPYGAAYRASPHACGANHIRGATAGVSTPLHLHRVGDGSCRRNRSNTGVSENSPHAAWEGRCRRSSPTMFAHPPPPAAGSRPE